MGNARLLEVRLNVGSDQESIGKYESAKETGDFIGIDRPKMIDEVVGGQGGRSEDRA
jgi:hypothetical protein